MRPLTISHLLGFRSSRRSTLLADSSTTIGSAPPSLRHQSASIWQRLTNWLLVPSPENLGHPINRLPGVRAEFVDALADAAGHDADALRNRIALSRSLRELWHLRTEVYRVVGVARSQTVAQERLTHLNRHFPAPAPRSQFSGL